MRLNQYIAHNSQYSRREADELIKQGRVKVGNAVVRDFSCEVNEKGFASLAKGKEAKIYLNGTPLMPKKSFSVIVYNKPKGELVSKNDPRGRRTIYESLGKKFSTYSPVGRLDYASCGLLLLSDSPLVIHALTQSHLERTYLLKLKGYLNDTIFEAMEKGITLQNATAGAHPKSPIQSMSFAPFCAYEVLREQGGYTRIKVSINEGKNRELRRFFAYFGLEVVDLMRVSFGFIELQHLKSGGIRFLDKKEYELLHAFLKEQHTKNPTQ